MADDIDEGDISHGSNYSYCLSSELKKLSRPYLVSGGIENGIQYIFTMNPLMSEILSKAEFIETDITYNETYLMLQNLMKQQWTGMWLVEVG